MLACLCLAAWIPGPVCAASIPIDGYAAVVNDRIITVSDVLSAVQPIARQLEEVYQGEELVKRLDEAYREGLKSLVDRALILEDFKTQKGELPERVVDERIEEIIHERFDGNRSALLTVLSEERITPDEWREQIKDQIIVSLLRRQEVQGRISISPREVRALYQQRIDTFQVPEMAKVSMIVLNKGSSPEDEAAKRQEADQILAQLDKGEDFAALAREHSEGSRAARGGDWDWIDPAILKPELAQVVRSLAAGAHSEVIESEKELYILQIEARRNASVVSFEEARKDLEEELRRDATNRVYESWIERLRGRHFVKVYEADLATP